MSNATCGHLAAELFWLCETLLPGDPPFPSGGLVGAQAAAASRLAVSRGEDALQQVAAALCEAGGPLAGQPEDRRSAIVAAFEAKHPALFEAVRTLVYLAYYESPLVIAAIRETGTRHNLTPQPEGYDLPRFDPARDAPRHGRGHYVRTGDVRRVDLSGVVHVDA